MARPVIATKLYVPRLRPGLVARPRLRARLRAGSRLTLVSAPAGFGKTTALAEWLAEVAGEGHAVAWLSLDPEDSEPTSFWTCAVTALQTAVPDVSALALVASSPTEHLLTVLLNELAAVHRDVWLVLDDYHLVSGKEVNEGVAFLVEHLPPHVHVVISTRADPDLPLSRWRVRGELAEVRAEDLRFTTDEVAAYLSGLDLGSADVAALAERTEGWIAALQLAALSLRGRADVSGFIARFAGDDRYVVDYLVEEVLRHQPGHVRDFLLRSAVLDRLTGPLCDAVTGRDDGSTMLVSLDRANLFLVPLDDRREWYRYHHLFADVLRTRLLAEQPDLVPLLHQRASQWHEHHELTEAAVRHALAAHDVDRAAYLMELAVPAIRLHRQEALLLGWLTALPDDVVRRSPVLSVFHGYLLLAAGDLDAVAARFDDAERALAAAPDDSAPRWAQTEELRTLPATIAVHRASLAQARGDVAGTAEQARRALELAGPDDHLARAGATGFLGLAAWARGDVSTALETFTQAVASLHAAGAVVDELSGTVVLADLWLAAGRPGTARQACERALRLAEAHGVPLARASADLHVALSELDREVGDLDNANRHLAAAATIGEHASMAESRYRWFVAGGRIADAEGEPGRAIALLDQAEQLYRPGFFPNVRPIAAMRARVWISRGQLARVADWAREHDVSTMDTRDHLSEYDHLTAVRLLIARHRAHADTLGQAVRLLDRLHDAAEAAGRGGSLLEIGVLRALAHDAGGDRPRALESLARTIARAPEPEGYTRLFLDEGAPMVDLLREATHHAVLGDLARRLLGPGAAQPTPTESLSGRELQVLGLLDSELSGPQIARELFVSHNTVRTHTKHIFTKLDVTSRRAAVLRARERGLM